MAKNKRLADELTIPKGPESEPAVEDASVPVVPDPGPVFVEPEPEPEPVETDPVPEQPKAAHFVVPPWANSHPSGAVKIGGPKPRPKNVPPWANIW